MTGARILSYRMSEIHDIDTELDFAAAAWNADGVAPQGKTFVFSLTALVAQGTEDDLAAATPEPTAVSLVNRLHALGNTVLVHAGGDPGSATDDAARRLRAWGVKFDRLVRGRPQADFYVDDRMIPMFSLQRWLGSARN